MGMFQKIYDAVAGQLNEIVNEKCSTPQAYAMSIRRLEDAINKFGDAKIKAKASRNIIESEVIGFKVANSKNNAKIDVILGDGDPTNDYLAEDLQIAVLKNDEEIANRMESLDEADKIVKEMEDALKVMEAKRVEMIKDLRNLERKAASTEAKNDASKAIKDAMGTYGKIDSIDSIKSKVERNAEEANIRFTEATSGVKATSNADDEILRIQAKAALDARRKALDNPTDNSNQ